MKAVIQRVTECSVEIIDGDKSYIKSSISQGFLVLLGINHDDTEKEVEYIKDKITGLRIFEDENGKMNLSLSDIGGSILLVSQFTLLADTKKGKRPSFIQAARPETAIPLYEKMIEGIKKTGVPIETGEFGAEMKIRLVNDGPVTIIIDTKEI